MRIRLRDQRPEPLERRHPPAHETALFRGAAIELTRMGGEVAKLDAENGRLRALLAKHGICPDEKP